ncbi:V-type ATP synthase subunit D [Parachlamydia sp. AcF125]|uniref:V-type ATP synthase subunit D n=1 Tax=Parachlamydia sp. AcF125 TaxID=2795736 RepID=UPI001BC99FB1|nr:V-type ATP synthase subunit D [Parachlamydia sp. AcF125]MBS4167476.1 V-type ATP synthase subunit D [Parachlamydia sp. AcF125]
MAEIKLTKNELRSQQGRLGQLQKYLPTLQLKKAMLQSEVNEARHEIAQLERLYKQKHDQVEAYSSLFSEKISIDFKEVIRIVSVDKHFENIAGVEVPYFESIKFADLTYDLFETPPWVDSLVLGVRSLMEVTEKIKIVHQKKSALEKEFREVSIRVNLFEKILIPRALANIKKIKVFLGDQELAAVARAKVAKEKVEAQKAVALEHKALREAGDAL